MVVSRGGDGSPGVDGGAAQGGDGLAGSPRLRRHLQEAAARPLVASLPMVAGARSEPRRASQRAWHAVLGACGVAALVAISACTGSAARSGPTDADRAAATTDVPPTTDATATTERETTVPPATDEPPTTDAATIEAPTTEVPESAAPATDGPTTAAAVPTTEALATAVDAPPPSTVPTATTTAAPLPSNRVPIAPATTPLAVVGEQSGAETARVQQRLLDLGFWLTAADGQYGLATRQAVMAFQKYLGLNATGSVDEPTAAFMSGLTERAYGRTDLGTLLEIDKTRQILMFMVDGRTQWVFNTSTGNGEAYIEEDQNSPGTLVEGVSLTPDGLHKVNRERPEGWWEGDLGQIYRPKYFVGGVAVHGSNSVPNYPASHGCVRVTVEAMDFIWEAGLMPMRLPVWVHEQPSPI